MYSGYKPNTNKSFSTVNIKRGLSETRVESLQRQIDNYTRRIQQQKRKHATVQQNYNNILKEYQEQKAKLDKLKKSNATGQITALFSKIKSLEGTLDKSVSLYDDTLAENNKLKTQIDKLRRDKKNYKQIYRNLQQQIKKADIQSARKMQIIDQKKNRTQNLKNQIMLVRQRNEQDKINTLRQFESLEKNYLHEKRMRQVAKLNQKTEKIEILDTQPLLKMRLKKIIVKNAQKLKIINDYQNNIKRIESAFEQIKKGSGIQDLEEITNNFIQSEEQNYSLYNYVDTLTQNIGNLEQQYKDLQKKIHDQQIENKKRKGNLQLSPQKRQQKKSGQARQHEQKAKQLTQFVQQVGPGLQKVLFALAKSKYNDDPNKLQDYQINGININERNIEQYLSDLEKYINILIEQKSQQTIDTSRLSVLNHLGKRQQSGNKFNSVIIKPEQLKIKEEDNILMNFNDMKQFAKQFIKQKRK